jgi:hypothetical protein
MQIGLTLDYLEILYFQKFRTLPTDWMLVRRWQPNSRLIVSLSTHSLDVKKTRGRDNLTTHKDKSNTERDRKILCRFTTIWFLMGGARFCASHRRFETAATVTVWTNWKFLEASWRFQFHKFQARGHAVLRCFDKPTSTRSQLNNYSGPTFLKVVRPYL